MCAGLLVVAGCGDDEPTRAAGGEFAERLTDVCAAAQWSFDQLAEPEDLPDIEDLALDAVEILEDAQADLAELVPPPQLALDFQQLRDVLDDEIEQYRALADAAADGDATKVAEVESEILSLYGIHDEIAEDLAAPDCSTEPGEASEPPTSADPSTPADPTAVGTDEPTSTVETTSATSTTAVLPTIPITTAPPTTPVTTAAAGASIDIDSIADNFVAPAGFTMVDTEDALRQEIVDGVAAFPELGPVIDVMGVADLIEQDTNIVLARVFIAFTADDGPMMPTAWSTFFCGDAGVDATTPGGFTGQTCSIDDGAQHFHSVIGGRAGFTVLAVDPEVDLGALIDAFFAANPGA